MFRPAMVFIVVLIGTPLHAALIGETQQPSVAWVRDTTLAGASAVLLYHDADGPVLHRTLTGITNIPHSFLRKLLGEQRLFQVASGPAAVGVDVAEAPTPAIPAPSALPAGLALLALAAWFRRRLLR